MSDTLRPLPPSKLPRSPSRHDGLAITGFIFAFIAPPLGLILSWVSITTAHRDGANASGLAVTGLVLSAIVIILFILLLL